MCSTTLWARNVSSSWLGCARGTALSTAFALPANWTRMAPPLTPPGRRLRRVTSAPTTLATSYTTSAGRSTVRASVMAASCHDGSSARACAGGGMRGCFAAEQGHLEENDPAQYGWAVVAVGLVQP